MVHTTTPQLLQSGQLIKNEAANQMKNANEETLHAFLASTCGFRLFSGLKLHAAAAAAAMCCFIRSIYIHIYIYKQIDSGT
jgi:uncharacterized MAPEG superfamily protein